ncbi:MAG: hypothetical protein RL230_981 [Pseudomonadota bacterium]|jgi:hypothetical protein
MTNKSVLFYMSVSVAFMAATLSSNFSLPPSDRSLWAILGNGLLGVVPAALTLMIGLTLAPKELKLYLNKRV